MLNKEHILGIKINTGMSLDDVVSYIESVLLSDDKAHYICTTNPEFIIDAQSDKEFAKIINDADLSLPDGIGVILAFEYKHRLKKYAKYKGTVIYPFLALFSGIMVGIYALFAPKNFQTESNRVTGVSISEKICELSAKKGYSVFFLGGSPRDSHGRLKEVKELNVAETASRNMSTKYPQTRIIGATSSFSRNETDDIKSVEYIRNVMKENNVTTLDFLLVAYNHIFQEKWILRNASRIPARVSIGIGRTLDVFAGIDMKPNSFLNKYNLEWLYRLINQPWRLKRVIKAFPIFPLKIFIDSLR